MNNDHKEPVNAADLEPRRDLFGIGISIVSVISVCVPTLTRPLCQVSSLSAWVERVPRFLMPLSGTGSEQSSESVVEEKSQFL